MSAFRGKADALAIQIRPQARFERMGEASRGIHALGYLQRPGDAHSHLNRLGAELERELSPTRRLETALGQNGSHPLDAIDNRTHRCVVGDHD